MSVTISCLDVSNLRAATIRRSIFVGLFLSVVSLALPVSPVVRAADPKPAPEVPVLDWCLLHADRNSPDVYKPVKADFEKFKTGDRLRVRVHAYRDLKVYLAVKNDSGELALLLPETGGGDPIQMVKDETRDLPPTGNWQLKLVGTPQPERLQLERLRLVAAQKNLVWADKDLNRFLELKHASPNGDSVVNPDEEAENKKLRESAPSLPKGKGDLTKLKEMAVVKTSCTLPQQDIDNLVVVSELKVKHQIPAGGP